MASDIYTPDYSGPDRRREMEVVVKKCFCHTRHEQILDNHGEDIRDIKINCGDSGKAIASKVPNKLFYLFVVIIIGGLGVVYNGVHKVDKSLAVFSEKMDNTSMLYHRLENEMRDVRDKVQNYIYQTNNKTDNKIKKRREE